MYVENVTARERGLLGMWAAENVIGEIDPVTGAILEERRTDIVYGWNDASRSFELVFEFKRMGKQKSHRTHYLREKGHLFLAQPRSRVPTQGRQRLQYHSASLPARRKNRVPRDHG